MQTIHRERVDLIQSHLLGANVYCSLAGLLTRTPVVTTFHGSVDIGQNERFQGLKFGAINAGASSIVAVTDSLRDDILGRTPLKVNRTCVIYNGIDTSIFQRPDSSTLRQKYGWSEKEIVIGSLGNIRPAKGYDILLRAASLLANSPRSYRFVIAGQSNSSLIDELHVLRKELGLEDKVQFLGFVDDPAEFLANLDIFLSSSISEGLPLSAIQAMVAKLPIVATRCGGWQELITHQENGWLVEVESADAIAEAIEVLAADSGLCSRLSGKARNYAIETFDIKVMLNAYEQLYSSLITH